MSFRASITEQFERWLVEEKAMPDAVNERKACGLTCPVCGADLGLCWGRNQQLYFAHHYLSDCQLSFRSWRGETREQAIAAFVEWRDAR